MGDVVIPFEVTAKGEESIDGLDDLVDGLEHNINIDVGVLAIVPIGYKETRDRREILERVQNDGFSVPIVVGQRGSLMEGCWRQQCSPYKYIEEHRDRHRDYELTTLEKFDDRSRYLEQEANLESSEVTA